MKDWFVYVLECADGSLYTGISNDVEKRVNNHNRGSGARYTRGRTPVVVRYTEKVDGKGKAQSREAEIKKLGREGKMNLIRENGGKVVKS